VEVAPDLQEVVLSPAAAPMPPLEVTLSLRLLEVDPLHLELAHRHLDPELPQLEPELETLAPLPLRALDLLELPQLPLEVVDREDLQEEDREVEDQLEEAQVMGVLTKRKL